MAKKEEKAKSLYVFRHPNKFLMVADLGVQFINGEFSTEDREIAKKLVNVEDMELISQP